MCYDIKAQLESQLKRARQYGDQNAIVEIMERLAPMTDLPLFHASGFTHPDLFIYTMQDPYFPTVATWGLIPPWAKDEAHKNKLWNSTLNARGETIFEKASFKSAAVNKRCIIPVDGFYEYHHFNDRAFPFYIHPQDDEPLYFAGLYSEWKKDNSPATWTTFTIVTCKGNNLMSHIHNSPKFNEPRMPLILNEDQIEIWLGKQADMMEVLERLEQLIKPNREIALNYHTVQPLRGKAYLGNMDEVSNEFEYEGLEINF